MADFSQVKLSRQDQIFVYAMHVICCSRLLDEGRHQAAVAELREALPHVSRQVPFIDKIAAQAGRILAAPGIKDLGERRAEYHSAQFRGAGALNEFFFWRMGLSAEAQKAKGEAA